MSMTRLPGNGWRAVVRAAVLTSILSAVAVAQGGVIPVGPPQPPRDPRSLLNPQTRDTTRRDSTKAVTANWGEPDSVMRALLGRKSYEITRFHGDSASFDAANRGLVLIADSGKQVQIQRGQEVAISDCAIRYDQAPKAMISLCGRYGLHDPSSTQAPDIRGVGALVYDFGEKSVRFENASFPVQSGETWQMAFKEAKIVGDSTAGMKSSTTYMSGLIMTSCLDSVPDYYLQISKAKRNKNGWLFTGPATLFLTDGKDWRSAVPVLKLPFFLQSLKGGRASGILTPRFGVSDIVRNSPTYRRNVENVGYYWAINDLMNAALSMDWRSGAGGTNQETDPGWLRWQGEWDYFVRDRFLRGATRVSYQKQNDGQTNTAISWNHDQQFAHEAKLVSSLNYVSSTRLQRQNTLDPYAATATIRSQANFSRRFGSTMLTVGGSRTQQPGRDQVDQMFPSVTLSSETVRLSEKSTWTPSIGFQRSGSYNLDQQGPFSYVFRAPGDSTRRKMSSIATSLDIKNPLVIGGTTFSFASIAIASTRNKLPTQFTIRDVQTGDSVDTRVYAETFQTTITWDPGFQLPSLAGVGKFNKFKLTPSISLSNVDPGPFFIKTERTDGRFVRQTKRITGGISSAPTIYGYWPGLGRFSEFRHIVNPVIGYSWAPKSSIPDAYLEATGRTRKGYLGALAQSAVSFGVNQSILGYVKRPGDTTAGPGEKINLLSINASSFSYDFRRADTLKAFNKKWTRGLTTDRLNLSLGSDLLPGVNFSMDYSLFQGSLLSDTAVFKPYRESVAASFSIGRAQNPLSVLTQLFGTAVPDAKTGPTTTAPQPNNLTPDQQQTVQSVTAQPVAGARMAGNRQVINPAGGGWRASLTFSSSRPRPPVGGNVIDFNPRAQCEAFAPNNQFIIDACLAQAALNPNAGVPVTSLTQGGQAYRIQPTTNMGGDMSFNLTPAWAVSWRTNYDFVRAEFASHIVSLQRDMHDWRSIFAFTQAPNGNFAFSFTIGLKAEPDFKFDYNKATVRSGSIY
jgi:hypothetical protein